MPEAAFQGCNAKYDLVVTYEADFYLCTDEKAQATAEGCPKAAWQFLKRATLKNVEIDGWAHHFSGKDIVRAGWQNLFGDVAGSILFSVFAEDLMDCWHGDKTACAWSIAAYLPLEASGRTRRRRQSSRRRRKNRYRLHRRVEKPARRRPLRRGHCRYRQESQRSSCQDMRTQ